MTERKRASRRSDEMLGRARKKASGHPPMNRRAFLIRSAGSALLPAMTAACASPPARGGATTSQRVRPTDPDWPDSAAWNQLDRAVGGRLVKVESPLDACVRSLDSPACAEFIRQARNAFYVGDHVGLTQCLGWVDAWTSRPSVYAVAAETTENVVAAVNFARTHRLRLVVKGGGHSYLGTSNAADSLLIWTRRMNAITLHDAFVARGCADAPQPAVTIGAGAMWLHAYDAVTTKAGRYVQGGGCTTVGVPGLVQSGGFGSFSKRYGLAAAGLLEAEVVTADGTVRIANACTDPDLFWAIKGGGGGSFGVVTRLTLRTRDLPAFFGPVNATIKAGSDGAYRTLIRRVVDFYADRLFDARWGEQIVFGRDNTLTVRMVFQGLTQQQAEDVWRPFFDAIQRAPEVRLNEPPFIVAVPARHLWDPRLLKQVPGVIVTDDRPGAPEGNFVWAGDAAQASQVLQAYRSCWLPATLLAPEHRERTADAFFAATRHRGFALHFNKGLAGAPAEERAAAANTATNPAVLDAFALAICAATMPPAYPGVVGHVPDVAAARRNAAAVDRAMDQLLALAPNLGSYVSESGFFEREWQRAYWGANYARLASIKEAYDPDGLFTVHHGVGSERWSADGFSRLR